MLNRLQCHLPPRHFRHVLFAHSLILMVIYFFLIIANFISAYVPSLCLFVSTVVSMQIPALSLNRHMQISFIHAVITFRLLNSIFSSTHPIFGRANIGSPDSMISDIQVALSDISVSLFFTFILFIQMGFSLFPILAYFSQ